MLREVSPCRPDWRETCESVGFTFHSQDGIPYWDESVRYRFRLAEIEDDIESPTQELLALCYDAVGTIANDERALARLEIPQEFWPAIAESWRAGDHDLYGRFDLAYDGSSPAKLLEFNADTPTALLESAVVQWQWLEDMKRTGLLPPTADQFNSIHDRLIDALRRLKIDGSLHLAALAGNEEDQATVTYVADCAMQAGIRAVLMTIEDIGVDDAGHFTDLQNRIIGALFKLYPWEWMAREKFGRFTLNRPCRIFEPVWKMILSNKGLCAELWRLHPGHPNLLPSYYDDDLAKDGLGVDVVNKRLLGREGSNIEIRRGGALIAATEGPYAGRSVLQALAPVYQDGERTAILGSWVVAGQASGLCVREEEGPITTNRARFIPHYIQD